MVKTSPASKFRQAAENLQKQIDHKRAPRLTNTHKRQREAESALQDALALELLQDKLHAVADAWDEGSIPGDLKHLSAKNQVEYLCRFVNRTPDSFESYSSRRKMSQEEVWMDYFPAGEYSGDERQMMLKAHITEENWIRALTALRDLGDPNVGKETEADQLLKLEREVTLKKIPDFFPTPPDLINDMLSHVYLAPDMKVLEPSAGKGDIADAIRDRCPDVQLDVVEWNHSLGEILKLKGHNVIGSDCFDLSEPVYDLIVANPPFSGGADMDHVEHYFKLLKPGGTLVSLMSESPFFSSKKRAQEFRDWVDDCGYSIEMGSDRFKQAERSTGVAVRIVVLEAERSSAPAVENQMTIASEPASASDDVAQQSQDVEPDGSDQTYTIEAQYRVYPWEDWLNDAPHGLKRGDIVIARNGWQTAIVADDQSGEMVNVFPFDHKKKLEVRDDGTMIQWPVCLLKVTKLARPADDLGQLWKEAEIAGAKAKTIGKRVSKVLDQLYPPPLQIGDRVRHRVLKKHVGTLTEIDPKRFDNGHAAGYLKADYAPHSGWLELRDMQRVPASVALVPVSSVMTRSESTYRKAQPYEPDGADLTYAIEARYHLQQGEDWLAVMLRQKHIRVLPREMQNTIEAIEQPQLRQMRLF